MSPRLKKKHLYGLLILILSGILLQTVPGTYTLDDLEESFEPESPEGKVLLALGETRVEARVYFKRAARHRISRNAELLSPPDTWLEVTGVMRPEEANGEILLKPSTLQLRSDRSLTFVYRNVTVARAKYLRSTPEGTLEAVGYYQVLSALFTGTRYGRQREIRRDYQIPDRAVLNLTAELKELEPMVNRLLGDPIPDSFDVGSVFSLEPVRFHHLRFLENHLDLHVDGKLSSAKSRRVSDTFHPGFRIHLGVDLELPAGQTLADAEIGVSLKQIHALDFNRSNPILDKALRNLLRSRRDDARIRIRIAEEVPEISDWPGDMHIEAFSLLGEGADQATLNLRLRWEKTDAE